MEVIAKKTPAFLETCPQCGALLAFGFGDIEGNCVYCPICRNRILTRIDMKYDGRVKCDGGEVEGEKR